MYQKIISLKYNSVGQELKFLCSFGPRKQKPTEARKQTNKQKKGESFGHWVVQSLPLNVQNKSNERVHSLGNKEISCHSTNLFNILFKSGIFTFILAKDERWRGLWDKIWDI